MQRAEQPRRGAIGAVHGGDASAAAAAAGSVARSAGSRRSMITRHGRSASTVSSVRPNSEPPARRGGSAITIARAP